MKKVRLGNYVKIKTGKLDANASSPNGQYPFFTCSVTPLKIDTYSYDCECVLVAGNGDLNVKYYNGKFDAYQRTYIIESADKTKLSVPYLYCFLDKYVETLRQESIGGVIKYIKLGNLTEAIIPLLSIESQQKIVEDLKMVSGLIEKRKEQLAKLDQLVKSRFIELFGDPKTNNKKWRVNTFEDICTVRQGLQIPISKRLTQYEEGCYEYITVAYLHGSKEREYIKNPKSTVICTEEDVLMTRTGNTGMVITNVAGAFHNNFFLIDFDRTRYNKVFLVEYLNLDLIQAEIKRRAGTSTIPDLNHGEFYAISIYEPPVELQNQFAAFVEQTDKSKLAIQQSLEQLETLKKSLMQKYFG